MKKPQRDLRIQHALLTWFSQHARDLPWRRTRDPYAIWLSEIMLQQTRVATAIPYYERFLQRFPTVRHLARARLDTVLKMWEGLGYYSRARNLHAAAREIVSRFHGQMPCTRDELLTLPGIGRYTAGAVASIAFGAREPVVDGNVERVLCRVFRIHGSPKDAAIKERIWSLAEDLLPEGVHAGPVHSGMGLRSPTHDSALGGPFQPMIPRQDADATDSHGQDVRAALYTPSDNRVGQFNQALMDLGSEICTPRNPRCDKCPLNKLCEANRHHEQDILPTRTRKKPLPNHVVVVAVIYRAGRILIDKRKPHGLLGGLWEFPGGKVRPGEALEAALHREIREELDVEIEVGREIVVVEHTYTHFHVEIHAFECQHIEGEPRCITCADLKWVRPSDLPRHAFPAANKKIIEILRHDRSRRVGQTAEDRSRFSPEFQARGKRFNREIREPREK